MFIFYQYICFKNILGKIFKFKFKTQKFKNITFHFDNFYAFFALFNEIFIYNIYYFESSIDNPVIVDCGGNIGISVIYFKYLYPKSIIHCYEPDRETFKILEKNIKSNNLANVKIYNKAVSGSNGELEFYSFGDMEGGTGNTLEKSQVNFSNINNYKVEVVKLSDIGLKHINLLKIDIEGSEGKVFKDIDKSFINNIDRIILEYHYDEKISDNKLSDIISVLENNNFHILININSFVTFYAYYSDFLRWNNKYVLMLNAFRNK
ncbi:FkbM family methyltransferase [Candidatus Gracilibacteria bacterium]|nr:FkbM family methyltransferase [Candidatus Gracilibacteria bacterium]